MIYTYRIERWSSQNTATGETKILYKPAWRRGWKGTWHLYYGGTRLTWNDAYDFIEKRATPAAMAVRFVGTV